MGKFPKRWGLSLQRLDKRAVEQDPGAVARWHQGTWPKIRAKAKAAPGARMAARPWCGGAGTGSRCTRCRRSAPRAGCSSWSSPSTSPPR
ncbi:MULTISPECIES: winged helix-turn-helix domain-containing protein [Streptomyces]|uniref:winged helix-turn-helix domain-containing protein n=1 Tax=Streptomyces TaxID=1883 RepID=UPI001FD7B10D|nr:winged helix-turn-helix domain-containing protein [Streptomyces griseolus]